MIAIKRFFSDNKLIFAAFFLPVLLVIVGFAVTGIYPFGHNQIAVIDMYHQYVPFLSELQYKLQEGGNLFYTWNGAAGSNFWNLMAYYGASPLNLLLVLFPKKFLMEGITVILLIKIGLSGSFMAIYLRYLGKAGGGAVLAFAAMYALNSYVMAYYWCIMWIDAVMLLPLCILGLNRIIDGGKAVMYTVSLALVVFSNYYMAIMVCIFIMIYYPVLYFIKVKGAGARVCAVITAKAVGYSFLAIAMAAVMLLPTYISMQSTFYISADMPADWVFYNDALDIVNQLLPYSQLTFREGLPNLYCGMLIVIMLVFYILSKSISFREKMLNGGLLVFLFLSLNINKLDFIWHGFHFPNQLPYRYTFAICFVLIGMAYRAFTRIDEIQVNMIWKLAAAGTAYYLIAQKLLDKAILYDNLYFYGGIAWMALFGAVIILYRKNVIRKKVFVLLVIVVVTAEMASNVCTAFDTIGNTDRFSYYENYADVAALAEITNEEFCRAEMDYEYTLNCPAMYHYRGISQFSSSINADTTAIMEKIGIEGEPGKNRFTYNQTVPVLNSMLNVRYLIAKNLPLKDPDFEPVAKKGYSKLYESRYPLSIGYMLGDEIRTWRTEDENPFNVLDDYIRAATANKYESVFETVSAPSVSAKNANAVMNADGKYTVTAEDKTADSNVTLKFKSDKTQKYYVFIESVNADSITAVKGEVYENIEIRNDCGSIINIGEIEEGKEFKLSVKYKSGSIGDITCHVRTLDQQTWDKAYDIISKDLMEVTDYGDNYIKGTVKVSESGVLVTSIPYEKGWRMKVDGQRYKINDLIGDVFISVPLQEGIHEIELKFRPPGLIEGIIISCFAALVLAALQLMRKHRLNLLEKFLSTDVQEFSEDEEFLQEEADCSITEENCFEE